MNLELSAEFAQIENGMQIGRWMRRVADQGDFTLTKSSACRVSPSRP